MRFMRLIRFAFTMLGVLAITSAFAQKVVLGKLGQSTEATPIFARQSGSSRVYYHVKAYEYLVLQSTKSAAWLKVLMENGTWGYIRSGTVAKLPYQVVKERPQFSQQPLIASRGSTVAREAITYIGTPYVWGGNDPTSGIDCSGFVKQMFGQIGLNLPRTAAEQVKVGKPITRYEDLREGDRLYFWDAKRGIVGHTGIYLGKGYFVHSSRGNGGVATDYLGSKNWRKILVAARR
jgi:cell wall-associated NlpC family hydrolase